ncbi:molecular chaperone DnaJ [Candidatus Woesearchaeota archaeon]|nr:molecular chaperone DnaJ [Candidatus Woesearchaeota archaeon]
MPKDKDYYKILGVEKNATKEEIKKAYKKLAKQYHPDVSKEDGSTEKFKEINEAASVLGDDEKRAQYDQFGTTYDKFAGHGFDFSDFGFDSGGFESFDFGDIFDRFFGTGFGFGPRTSKRRARRGADLRYDMEITLEDAAFGAVKHISIPKLETCDNCDGSGAESKSDIVNCPDCGGKGSVTRTQRTPFGMFATTTTCSKCRGEGKYIRNECPKCDGTGVVKETKKLEIKIPEGAEEGTNLRVAGGGEAGEKGASPGDLYIVLHMKEHDVFERDGDNINVKVNVPFTIAALGGEIEVPTLDGKAKLRIPAGTQSNTTFRMQGKGIPFLHDGGRGDENVEVVVSVPKKLTKRQAQLLKEFEKESKNKGFLGKMFE